MRINKYLALTTGMSRRAADKVIATGNVMIDGVPAQTGSTVMSDSTVTLNGAALKPIPLASIAFHKPRGYVVSRDGQGSKSIYDILPSKYHHLKPVGRLDKDSSGILIVTNDGDLAHALTHPSYQKRKIYEIKLDKPLVPLHRQMITDHGIALDDGPSKLLLERLRDGNDTQWLVTMSEGRNRQIRRTFAALGYEVIHLHRIQFGPYQLQTLSEGDYRVL